MAAFVARFERSTETREGRISASFDAVRVFLSARAQVGSVSQLLRLNAAGTLVADVADMRNEQAAPMVGAIGLFEADHFASGSSSPTAGRHAG